MCTYKKGALNNITAFPLLLCYQRLIRWVGVGTGSDPCRQVMMHVAINIVNVVIVHSQANCVQRPSKN